MTGGTIGLVMIVKNEADTLPRLAESLAGQIDRWTIVDTGSTDNTVELVPRLFAWVPGQLIEDRWRGFGPSRNVALAAARGHTQWSLTLDADDTLEGDVRGALAGPANGAAAVDAIEAELRYDNLSYWVPRLVSGDPRWHWRGRAHEYLTLGEDPPTLGRTTAFRVVHHADGGNRADKLERELGLLADDMADDPSDPRTLFYLARTHEDGGAAEEAVEFYRRRLDVAGWEEETWYARWRLGSCLLGLGRADEGAGVLLRAWSERPWRAEPLWTLAEHYRTTNQWQLGWEMGMLARRHTSAKPDGHGPSPSRDRLFVHQDVYDWRLAYERSICAYYAGERSAGRRLCDYLLGRRLPDAIRRSVEGNQVFYR